MANNPLQSVVNAATGVMDTLDARQAASIARRDAARRQRKLYASVSRRMMALLLDMAIIMLLVLPIMPALPTMATAGDGSLASQTAAINLLVALQTPEGFAAFMQLQLVQLLLLMAYVIGFLWAFQRTPGMWLLGLRVLQADRRTPPTRWQSVGFCLAGLPSIGMVSLGFLPLLWREDKRSWHELASRTAITTGYFLAEQEKADLGAKIAAAEAAENAGETPPSATSAAEPTA